MNLDELFLVVLRLRRISKVSSSKLECALYTKNAQTDELQMVVQVRPDG